MIYAFPILLLLVGIGFWRFQAHRRPRFSTFIDLGSAFLAIILLYGIVPGVGFLLAHLGIGDILDTRLPSGFDLAIVETVQSMYLFFAAAFALAYATFRRFRRVRHEHSVEARSTIHWLAPLTLVLLISVVLVSKLIGADGEGNYVSSYLSLRSSPIIVQQVFNVATQLLFASLVAATVLAVAAWPARHLRVAALIGCYLVYAVFSGGSRTTAFLCFFAYVVAASIYVQKLAFVSVAAMAASALGLFMFAGLFRDQVSDSFLGLLQSGEFTSLFINAVDLKERLDDGFSVDNPLAFYVVDLARLVPAQLLGGEKLDPAVWYAETFFRQYYELGGGLAFGVIAESVVGFGEVEAAMRGALLGILFAWSANCLIEGAATPAKVFSYVWLTVVSYLSIRDTTFSFLSRAIYQLSPILFFLWIFSPSQRNSRRVSSSCPDPS